MPKLKRVHMKTLKCFALVMFALLLIGLRAIADDAPATAPATEPAATSLLSNSDFSELTEDGKPKGWPIKDGITFEKEGDVRFLRFTQAEAGKMVMAYREVVLPKPHPAALEIHIRARAKDLKVGEQKWFDGRVMMNWVTSDRKKVKGSAPAPNFKGTTDWVDKRVVFAVPEKADMLVVMPCLFNVASGQLDISVLEITPTTADKLPPPPPQEPSVTVPTTQAAHQAPPLHVAGNQLQTPDGKQVWLQGLCVDSMEWSAGGEHIAQSIPVAIDQWHANSIRLPIKEDFWFGWGKWQKKGDNGKGYRKIVDQAVEDCAARGAYLILDLHRFGFPTQVHADFWKDAAIRYKDNPTVVFELFNEPHDISWKVWRYGGNIKDGVPVKAGAKENNEVQDEETSIGMQALVDAIRSTGAKNLIIAGGLNWSFNISGVLKGYALQDVPNANGIMYSTHIYPWKKDWQENFLDVAAKYPVFIGEVGNINSWDDFKFINEDERYEKVLGPDSPWPIDMIGLIQKHKLNWTAFSFHPRCGPMVITDWNYTPTAYWGVFVKRALAGEKFEMKNMR